MPDLIIISYKLITKVYRYFLAHKQYLVDTTYKNILGKYFFGERVLAITVIWSPQKILHGYLLILPLSNRPFVVVIEFVVN